MPTLLSYFGELLKFSVLQEGHLQHSIMMHALAWRSKPSCCGILRRYVRNSMHRVGRVLQSSSAWPGDLAGV